MSMAPPELHGTLNKVPKTAKKSNSRDIPLWNSFQDPPVKKASGSDVQWTKLFILLKIFKLLSYACTFAIVLLTSIVSKFLYVIMVTQTNPQKNSPICDHSDYTYGKCELSASKTLPWTWALVYSFSMPEVFTLFRSIRITCFKTVTRPTLWESLSIVIHELLHVVGISALTFSAFPRLDPTRIITLCSCVNFVPILASTLNRYDQKLVISTNILCLLLQASSFVYIVVVSATEQYIAIVVFLILTSFRWSQNYINRDSIIGMLFQPKNSWNSRYYIYLYLSPLKIIIFAMLGYILSGYSISDYYKGIAMFWNPRMLQTDATTQFQNITRKSDMATIYAHGTNSDVDLATIIMAIHAFSSYTCYIFAKFACKINIHRPSFALPLCLVTPITIGITIMLSNMPLQEHIDTYNFQSENIFYDMLILAHKVANNANNTIGVLCLLAISWTVQIWITRHIWQSKIGKNAPTEKIFVSPFYASFVLDQCITLNRRIHDIYEESENAFLKSDDYKDVQEEDSIPQLIVCATMWHETQEEIIEFLKSILRLDEDYSARYLAKIHLNNGKPDEDFYELESNIFFDDAFILNEDLCENINNPPLNSYVKTLITSIQKAAFEVYGTIMTIQSPVKIETPYGGRLVWTLPGRSKLIAHLKNKNKIRHKKRWSQVMYMYYMLGFRIMELDGLSPSRKAVVAENTFLLALDGDIDFQPQAVQLLINRMKAIDKLGAACGRIHPVGRGPMVWYQIFEYAIGHWLQKATEHVIGCVLCSPGCFSLFRGSALMEDSVIRKYTTVSSQPMHFVQYDQGEDRWLCTLILKQGFRVEYSAASDAYTHSPEMFVEFYNQRRRWLPSTIANIFDLLTDYKAVVRNNSSISTLYIFYQAMLMVGTILGPGTIFLMMVGALVTVFSINVWKAFTWNFFPVFFFILSCIYTKQKFQLLLAFVISAVYCLVMVAVLIGIVIQMIEDGPLAPASIFFLMVFAQIFIAGIVHPQEMRALVCGIIYYITIPSMYMLLTIYSVFNLNDVSWGTREGPAAVELDPNATDKSKNYLPGWVNDPLLIDSELGQISLKEKRFWKDLISAYLKPLTHSREEKAEIVDSLRKLRNIFAMAFSMINAVFVLIVFLLQLKKDYLHLDWPIDPIDTIVYDDKNSQIYVFRKYKELDPIGLCFVVFFGAILIIQFIAMFFHRFATMSQLLAAINLECFSTKSRTDDSLFQGIRGDAVQIARQLQFPNVYTRKSVHRSNGSELSTMKRRSTVHRLHAYSGDPVSHSDLQDNFHEYFYGAESNPNVRQNLPRNSSHIYKNLTESKHNRKPINDRLACDSFAL